MKEKKIRIKRRLTARAVWSAVILLLMIALILNPAKYTASVSKGLLVFATTVLPASFPFFFLTKLLTELGCVSSISGILEKPCKALFRVPGIAGYIYFMSILSGYPVGARLTMDLYEKQYLTSAQAARISTFTSTSGPLFVVGSVGVGMFASYRAGILLLLAHVIAAFLNGLLYRGFRYVPNLREEKQMHTTTPIDSVLSNSIYQSILSVVTVGGYIALFFMAIDILQDVKILYPLARGIEWLFKILGLPSGYGTAIADGLVEVTRGCVELTQLFASYQRVTFIVAGFSLSLGGACIAMQGLTYLTKAKVPVWFYLLSKLSHAIITLLICFGFSFLL